jgi:hypothetical protein
MMKKKEKSPVETGTLALNNKLLCNAVGKLLNRVLRNEEGNVAIQVVMTIAVSAIFFQLFRTLWERADALGLRLWFIDVIRTVVVWNPGT